MSNELWNLHCTRSDETDADFETVTAWAADYILKLEAALKKNIRIYRVADEAWDPDADVERLFKKEMGE